MQVVELYIGDTRVDLFKDESVSITDTITNAKDVAKVFTAFSQQFSLPASSTNNKIFKHYYNWNIVGGFDARFKVSAILKLNGIDFKIGKVKLNSVSLKDNKPYSYKIVFYGETVTLNDVLGEDKLSLLNFPDKVTSTTTDYNEDELIDTTQTFTTSVSIGDRVTNTTTNEETIIISVENNDTLLLKDDIFLVSGQGYIIRISPFYDVDSIYYKMQLNTVAYEQNSVVAPLITHTKRLFYDSVSHTTGDGNLYYHTGGGTNDHGVLWSDLKYAIRVDTIIKAITNTYPTIVFSNDFFNFSNKAYSGLFMWLHRKSGAVDTLSQVTNYPTLVNWGSGGGEWGGTNGTNLIISSDFDDASSQSFGLVLTPVGSNPYNVSITKNGNSQYEISGQTTALTVTANNLGGIGSLAGTYQITISTAVAIQFTDVVATLTATNVDYPSGKTETLNTGLFDLYTKLVFDIATQIPDMKTLDLLTGLFKMFNLVAYVKEDGSIYVDTLDDFYATFTTYDITKYIDVNTSSVDVALPYREINFQYEGIGSFLTKKYTQLNNEDWGIEQYNDSTEGLDGGIYKVVAPFEHMMFEKLVNTATSSETAIVWGYSVNENRAPYIGKPLLFYPNNRYNQGNISFRASDGFPHTSMNAYSVPLNSPYSSSSTSTANSNFGLMINEYSLDSTFTGTLYQNYYNTYISNLFKTSSRLVKYTAYLPLHIVLNYTLADIFVINGQYFRINSLNINLTNNKSQIELITTDSSPTIFFEILTESGEYLLTESNQDFIITEFQEKI